MIKSVKIRNFKSIKELDFSCKKINLFIGEPNVGKSNILEALTLFCYDEYKLNEVVRFDNMLDLFRNNEIDNNFSVSADHYSVKSDYLERGNNIKIQIEKENRIIGECNYEINGTCQSHPNIDEKERLSVKFFKYRDDVKFKETEAGSLLAPDGRNLVVSLNSHSELKKEISELVRSLGYKLLIKLADKKIEIYKEVDNVTYSFPYSTLSDTIKRIIFFYAAIETNKDSLILLEEPEANTFPFYTQDLANRIHLDDSNQYFIVTHNPYFLETLIQKVPLDKIQINICYVKNFETSIKQITTDHEITDMIDMASSVFFNFDHFIEE